MVIATVAFTALGIWAEHRWRDRGAIAARAGMTWALWTIVPFVVFFNLARADLDADLLAASTSA